MDTLNRLLELASRLDHLENASEWIARETVHTDNTISQTATLISTIADELREKLCTMVKEFEHRRELDKLN